MAGALVVEDGADLLAHILVVGAGVEGQDGPQLLVGVGVAPAHAVLTGHQDPGGGGDLVQAGQLGDGLHAAAHDLGVHGAVGAEDELAQLLPLGIVQEVGALLLHLGLDGGDHVLVADDGLLGGADGAVVEGLGIQDALDRQGQVAGLLQVGGAVARAHADGGGAGGVGRADHGGAAGGQDHGHVPVAHQVVGGLHGGDGDAGHQVLVAARLSDGLPDDLDGLHDAAQGRGVGGEHDGVARLDGDLRLIKGGGGGVGRGDEAGDDTHGHGDGADLLHVVPVQLAHGLHVLDVLVDAPAAEDVLDDLILDLAEAGVLMGHLGQTAGVAHAGVGDGADDVVHLGLGHVGQFLLGLLRRLYQLTDLLHGQ